MPFLSYLSQSYHSSMLFFLSLSFLLRAFHFFLATVTFPFPCFSSVCSAPRALFAHLPYVLCLRNIQAVRLVWRLWDSRWECLRSYRAVLALHAGAVEAQRSHAVADTLYIHHALVAPLARLWLRKVSGPQGNGSDLAGWNEDFTGVKELRAVLWK